MRKFVSLAAALGMLAISQAQTSGAEAQRTAAYTHVETGFIFDRPLNWIAGKRRNSVFFSIPMPDGTLAELELFGMVYSGTTDIWQAGQVAINKELVRETKRQWIEEILGCPLLLTESAWHDGETPITTQVGLLYAATPRKFLYRLSGPTEKFGDISYAFKQVLQTLRTDDGSQPKPFDPDSKPTPADLAALRGVPKRTIWKVEPKAPPKEVKASETVEVMAAGKKTILRYPKGWTVKAVTGGLELTHPQLAGTAFVEVLSTLDSPTADRALVKAGAASLALFKEIKKRNEPLPFRSKAGMTVSWITREGIAEGGYLATMDAAGGNAAHEYFTLRWQSSDAKAVGRSGDLLKRLVDQMGVELGE